MGDLQELEALAELGVNQEQLNADRMGPAIQFCDLHEDIVGLVLDHLAYEDRGNLRLTCLE
jgi:hypothetical protein